jgi:hypothetical protein
MYLARREFGKSARVYPVVAPFLHARSWTFSGPPSTAATAAVCGPGHCAIGSTPERALAILQGNDEIAADELTP